LGRRTPSKFSPVICLQRRDATPAGYKVVLLEEVLPMRIMPSVRHLPVVLLSVLLMPSAPTAQSARAPQIESITERELRADLFFLASDAMPLFFRKLMTDSDIAVAVPSATADPSGTLHRIHGLHHQGDNCLFPS